MASSTLSALDSIFFFLPPNPWSSPSLPKTEEKVRSASEYKPVERIDRQGQETTRRISRSNVVTNISIPNFWPLQGTYRCRSYGRLWWPWAGSHLGQSIHTIHSSSSIIVCPGAAKTASKPSYGRAKHRLVDDNFKLVWICLPVRMFGRTIP